MNTTPDATPDVDPDANPGANPGGGIAAQPASAVQADLARAAEVEAAYGESAFVRPLGLRVAWTVRWVALVFAAYHFLTAGFGLPVDYWHMGWHLCGLFVLVFTGFPLVRTAASRTLQSDSALRYGNVPWYDWLCIVLGCASALFLGVSWRGFDLLGVPEQTFRQGNPTDWDIFFGTVLIVLVLDIARRTLGIVLPAIISVFIAYALFGPYIPLQILQHPGVDWRQFVNNMYFPAEGIFGVTLWVVATIVFHFVLFGVIAQRTGLGQLFIDNAMILAGRYTGGPAKVSVVSSAFFGTISGSSVANTVSTGSLTIPNMIRLGYPPHFAGGVEASASAGGQITPPIMGAAAFIMAEFLEVPYTHVVIAAIFPALMHYVGVFGVVHLTAKRLGLSGFSRDALPQLGAVWRAGWASTIPLVALLTVLFTGYTPYMAAFCGISLCLIVGIARWRRPLSLMLPIAFSAFCLWRFQDGAFALDTTVLLVAGSWLACFDRREPLAMPELADGLVTGVGYALAVGAAAAAVGIVIGVINTTGIGFRIGFLVTSGAASIATDLHALLTPLHLVPFDVAELQLFFSLVLVAIACILMGAGIPTTALYIMLVSVAQPALAQLGVPPMASHLFVLYYGVIAEITPPVCTSAYAAAAIARSNPFRTGISAFTLGLGKVVAPMAFVYAPVLLIVSDAGFSLVPFLYSGASALLSVAALSTAVAGYLYAPMGVLQRVLAVLGGLVLLAPSWQADLYGMAILLPVFAWQWRARGGPTGKANRDDATGFAPAGGARADA